MPEITSSPPPWASVSPLARGGKAPPFPSSGPCKDRRDSVRARARQPQGVGTEGTACVGWQEGGAGGDGPATRQFESLSAVVRASPSSVLKVSDWSCVGARGGLLRPAYVSLLGGGLRGILHGAEPPPSQPRWGLRCEREPWHGRQRPGPVREARAVPVEEATSSTAPQTGGLIEHSGAAAAPSTLSRRCPQGAAGRLACSGSPRGSWRRSSPTASSPADTAAATSGCLLAELGSAAPCPLGPVAAAPDQRSPVLPGLGLRAWTSPDPAGGSATAAGASPKAPGACRRRAGGLAGTGCAALSPWSALGTAPGPRQATRL